VAGVSRATSFYYAFLVLPRPQREAIIAVWDFCRAVDDAVDEPELAERGPGSGVQGPGSGVQGAGSGVQGPGSGVQGPGSGVQGAVVAEQGPGREALRAVLAGWRDELDRCYRGTPRTAQGRALQPWIRHFDLSRQPFADLIDGVEMDLDRARYETFEALFEYCRRVASAVGLICIEIFGQRSDRAREYALNLGLALQLTNIIRDVGGDASRGRVYLPQEDLARFGCTDADLLAGRVTPPVAALLAFESRRAREYYERADGLLSSLDRRALVAAEIMGRIYRETLVRIERAGYDVFSARVRVPRARQAALAIATWLRIRVARHVQA
jgi:phytoene synthase